MFNIMWIIGAPFWAIVLVTAIARLNDIKNTQRSKRWIVRRIGLVFTIGAATAVLAKPFTISAFSLMGETTWIITLIGFGWALQLITTPNQEPWWKYMKGESLPQKMP